MRISFQIEYRTTWGENVRLHIKHTSATGKATDIWPDLSTADGITWSADVTMPQTAKAMEYSYHIVRAGAVVRSEWELTPRSVSLSGAKRMVCQDRWRTIPDDAYSHTAAFTEVFTPRRGERQPVAPQERSLTIRVFAHSLPQGCVLAVLGNQPQLGNWTAGRELRLRETAPNEWTFAIDTRETSGTVEYKFLAINERTGEQRGWEMRDNRYLTPPHITPDMAWVMQDESVRLPFVPWRGAGCVIPVFSLRSEGSFGIGDFGDIKRMADWLALTGQHILQILPINDTTTTGGWRDSYPYNCISVFALNPIYTDLRALPPLRSPARRKGFAAAQAKLNALPQVDYEKVYMAKSEYLRLIYAQEGEATMATAGYADFFRRNEEWLVPYAVFCHLRDKHGTTDFSRWGDMSQYDGQRARTLFKEEGEKDTTGYHCYVQYLLHTQLLDACQYARAQGVAIKGDIPIGISRQSVEAWTQPHYFHMDGQAGAPPDAFSPEGQNWGFPTYNWEAMARDGYRWWRRRLQKMEEYFDAYRIDHVLGFFRIWEIPLHSVSGLLGQFSPSLPLTVEEIEGYGLTWRAESYTRPLINDWTLNQLFGDRTAEVRHRFLCPEGNGYYTLRPEYATQRQAEKALAAPGDAALRNGLDTLISNVLFLADRNDPSTYHPRIDAQKTHAYHYLSGRERDAFNHLYEDYFYHRHNRFWHQEALRRLRPLVGSTRMLPCAEDLGMVPACVPHVMETLRILSLEIQTMPKNPQYAFGHLWENPYLSVATISTHDMPTMRGWWEEDREAAQHFYNEALYHDGPAPHTMPGWLAQQIVSLHLDSPSMLCLLSFQDWLATDEALRHPAPHTERINVPANTRQYWRYRMHLTIERLMGETALNDKLRKLIKDHGR